MSKGKLAAAVAVVLVAAAAAYTVVTRSAPRSGAPPQVEEPAGPVPMVPPSMQARRAEVEKRIPSLEQAAAANPKDPEVWTRLGNDYFDTRQPQKAIQAYDRALELNPRNANVLADRGVMHRDAGHFEQALADFRKANEVDPKHVQSLFNMGVLYMHDLKQPKKAIEAWSKVVETAPDSVEARRARAGIEAAKKALAQK